MKGYGWTIVMYGVGQPVAYLFAMGVGLATLVDTNSAGVFGGVSYLTFIAPALLISAAVMTAANEFTFPVMDGFKWRRVYYGPHASPLTPEQIAARPDHRRHRALPAAVRHLLRRRGAVRGRHPSAWGWVSILVATLAGLSFGLPLMAYAASIKEDKGQFAMVMRFIVMPLFLFSGTFFPLDTLPARACAGSAGSHRSGTARSWAGWSATATRKPPLLTIVHLVFLLGLAVAGWVLTKRQFVKRMGG